MNLLSKRNVLLVFVIAALLFAGLACNLPMLGRSKPTPTPIPVTGASVEELATQVASAAATAASGGPITLEFTEEQLTSAANLELQKAGETGVSNLQVALRDGLIKITGTASQNGFDLPLTVSLRVSANAQGLPRSEVVEAKVGPLSLPQNMIDQFTTAFDQLLNERFSQEAGDVAIDSITIADGKMTIVAHKR
jgi:uncharacterized protein YpmS